MRKRRGTPEWKEAISQAKKGKPLSIQDRARAAKQLREMNVSRRGIPRRVETKEKIRTSKTGIATSIGEVNGNWLGDNVQYPGIHQWLRDKFGAPQECQNIHCEGKSNNFDWAKRTDVTYQRRRENFLRLCRSCHRRYDLGSLQIFDIRDLLSK